MCVWLIESEGSAEDVSHPNSLMQCKLAGKAGSAPVAKLSASELRMKQLAEEGSKPSGAKKSATTFFGAQG